MFEILATYTINIANLMTLDIALTMICGRTMFEKHSAISTQIITTSVTVL